MGYTGSSDDVLTSDNRTGYLLGLSVEKTEMPTNLDAPPFRVLAIDGGGIRGIFPARILELFEEQLKAPVAATFDLVVGTSTGAILAAAAMARVPMARVAQTYESHAHTIFPRKIGPFRGVLSSKYASGALKALLKELLGTISMGELEGRLLLPTTDVSNGNVFVIKSSYLPSFVRDKNIPLTTAVLASCAAPSFFDPVQVGDYLLADGGLWANNPSFVAYTEAVGKLGVSPDRIRILSLGTGTGHQCYDPGRLPRRWGLATGWRGTRLIEAVMSIQGRSSSNMASLLLREKYLRLSFEETGSLPLDDIRCMPRLKSKASETFTYRYDEVSSFLQLR